MSKNYFTPKTGHEVSDIYLKNQPLWYDSDMLKHGIVWFIIGTIVGVLVSYI